MDTKEKAARIIVEKPIFSLPRALHKTADPPQTVYEKLRKASSSTGHINAVSGHTAASLIRESKNCSAR
jgi:hypothetical protein